MNNRTGKHLILLFLALYTLPVLSLHLIHAEFNLFENEGPANCPGCFLASQGLFNELPAIIVPAVIMESEEAVFPLDSCCSCFCGMPVKIGGNKSPPTRHLPPPLLQAA